MKNNENSSLSISYPSLKIYWYLYIYPSLFLLSNYLFLPSIVLSISFYLPLSFLPSIHSSYFLLFIPFFSLILQKKPHLDFIILILSNNNVILDTQYIIYFWTKIIKKLRRKCVNTFYLISVNTTYLNSINTTYLIVSIQLT